MKKKYKIILIVIAVLAIALFITHKILSWDEPPPQDDDLIIQRADVRDEQNAFYYLKQLDRKGILVKPAEDERLYKMMQGEEEWDCEYVEKIINRNLEVFTVVEKAIRCKVFQPTSPRSYLESDTRNLITDHLSWKAVNLFRQRKQKEAFDEAVKLVRLGHIMQGPRGNRFVYFRGGYIKRIGFERLRSFATETSLPPDVLRKYIEELASCGVPEQGLINAIKDDYRSICERIDDLAAGRTTMKYCYGYPFYPKRLGSTWLLMPNRTKRKFAETARIFIENVPRVYADMEIPEDIPRSFPPIVGVTKKIPMEKNSAGKIVYMWHTPHTRRMLVRKCFQNTEAELTRTLIALKCYKLIHGELPETLQELVPDYIDEIPIDDYNGQPLRYSQKKRIIYSVGYDLKDSGGPTRKQLEKYREHFYSTDDPAILIDF